VANLRLLFYVSSIGAKVPSDVHVPGADLLVLAAFDPELAPLRPLLGDHLAARVGGRTVVARTAGVGLAGSAAGAARHLVDVAPGAVVLVGSCGAYASAALAIGDVVVGRTLRLVDLASLDGLAEFPPPMATRLETDARLSEALAAFEFAGPPRARASACAACVATTLAITVDDAAALRIAAAVGADVEHLEAHGVATACAARGVPFAVVLGVANLVGSRGRAEWLVHHLHAEAAAGAHVREWLREGAQVECA